MEKKNSTQSLLTKINTLQKEIEESKSERDKKVGRREEVILQLQREHGLSSLEEAKNMVACLDNQITRRSAEIERLFEELQEIYEF